MMRIDKKVCKFRVTIFALALALVSLSGVVTAGDEGCVTCHAGPMALNTMLSERVANHPDVGPMVNTVPTDCAMCHAAGTEMALMAIIHPRHEAVTCDNCHVMDEASVPTGVKSGAKNW
jgi:hypothetical protein